MDMKISGSGVIGAGEYEDIRISGSGKMEGFVRCKNFSVSGAAHSDERIECSEEFHVSGSCSVEGGIKAGNLTVSGAFSCGKDISLSGDAKCSGSINCSGSFKGGYIDIAGKADIDGDMEGEQVKVSGKVNCGGLLNAEEVSIGFVSGMEIGSIGGSRINIYRGGGRKISRLPLLSSLLSAVSSDKICVKNSVEGDEIALENVHTPRVSGRIVAIGEGCEIDLVQYTEQIEVSPNAKVGKVEKV